MKAVVDANQFTGGVVLDAAIIPAASQSAQFVIRRVYSGVLPAPGGLLSGASDADGDPLSFAVVDQPTNGVLVTYTDGAFVYTPNVDYVGSDSFTYTVSAGGEVSAVSTVLLTVTQASAAGDVSGVGVSAQFLVRSVYSGVMPAPGGLLSGASDADGDPLSFAVVDQPANGVLVTYTDGAFVYTPNLDYFGSDSFTYTVSAGGEVSAVGTVSLTVAEVVAPQDVVGVGVSATFTLRQAYSGVLPAPGGLLSGVSDADGGPLSFAVVSLPANGTLTDYLDGAFIYVPDAGFAGTDSFTYRAYAGGLNSALAVVSITVNASSTSVNTYVVSITEVTSIIANGQSDIMIFERIYPGSENKITWVLANDSVLFDLDDEGVTKVAVLVGDESPVDSDGEFVSFGGSVVESRLGMALLDLGPGSYTGQLKIYSPAYPAGRVFYDNIQFRV